jgi:hypothetical protein
LRIAALCALRTMCELAGSTLEEEVERT